VNAGQARRPTRAYSRTPVGDRGEAIAHALGIARPGDALNEGQIDRKQEVWQTI